MRFLELDHLRNNMQRTISAFPGRGSKKGLKVPFLDVVTALQGVPLNYSEDNYKLDFRNRPVFDFLLAHGILLPKDIKVNCFFDDDSLWRLVGRFRAARKIIERADPNLLALVRQLVGTFAVYDITNHNIEGGSVSACIGMVYLCPEPSWDTEFFAEMMVHEYVHNALFLEDMVVGVFPDLLLLQADEAKVTSSVRRTRREYDKSFHAACVSATLAYFHKKLGNQEKSRRFLEPLALTVRELNEVDARLQAEGRNVLTDDARAIKGELTAFVRDGDFTHFYH